MSDQIHEFDYVVIGAGATAMAFADVILHESDRTVLLVDRHAFPGGHWNHAYPFVRLHQASAYYGVNSRPLGRHVRETAGLNAGLFELATGAQVLSYFDDVMREEFLPSGRITFLPMSEYQPDGTVVSLITGERTRVRARHRVVDAAYLGSDVPSQHTPSFPIDPRVHFMPINGLVSLSSPPSHFVVLGAGKTGADACRWLLERGTTPSAITWVRPRDLWFLNSAKVQPDATQLSSYASMIEASAAADSIDDLVHRFEDAELLLRVDASVWPTVFRGATCAPAEVRELSRIDNVVRLGHVTSVEPGTLHLEHGDVALADDAVVVDCTAEGLRRRPTKPIFEPGRITLEYTQMFGVPTYSAALIARAELEDVDDELRNLAVPALPVCSVLADIAVYVRARLQVVDTWKGVPGLQTWNDSARLNPASWALAAVTPDDQNAHQAIVRIIESSGAALENLTHLLELVPS